MIQNQNHQHQHQLIILTAIDRFADDLFVGETLARVRLLIGVPSVFKSLRRLLKRTGDPSACRSLRRLLNLRIEGLDESDFLRFFPLMIFVAFLEIL